MDVKLMMMMMTEGEVCQNRYFAYRCVWRRGVQTDVYVCITIDACILNFCLFIGTVAVIGLLQEIILQATYI